MIVERHATETAYHSETARNEHCIAEAAMTGPFVRGNHAHSIDLHVLRGLHLQIGPNPGPRDAILSVKSCNLPRLSA
jgi:hypothetical protein